MYLTNLDFIVVGVYFLITAGVGTFFFRRQTSKATYFLGNRSMSWVVVGVSVMAALVSTVSYVSVPGEMIRYGVGYFSSLFALLLILPVINRLIIPTLMRLPVTTVYEYYETRFGYSARGMAAFVFVLMRLVWIGLILYTVSFAITGMTGWDMTTVILSLGIITAFYTTFGGAEAAIWSGFLQGLLLMSGALIILVFVAVKTGVGPLGWWEVFSRAGGDTAPVFSWDPRVRISMIGIIATLFFWHICTHSADQVAAQRYLSTDSERSARRSVWIMIFSTAILLLSLMLVGLALFYFYWLRSGIPVQQFQAQIAPVADKQFPLFIAEELPSGLSGLLLAALLAAAMSSLSGAMNAIASVVITDFVDRLKPSDHPRTKNLGMAKLITLASAAIGIVIALVITQAMKASDWNLVELIERVNHLFVAPLGGLFMAGVLFRRVGAPAALLGFFAGVVTSFLISFSQSLYNMEHGISFMWIIPTSFLVSMSVSYAASFLFTLPADVPDSKRT